MDEKGVSRVHLGGLEWRMRDRWQTISRLWEENKAAANKLDLLGRLDYYGALSSQLGWQKNPGDRPIRVVYSSNGIPTSALLRNDRALVDDALMWITCKTVDEAYYLLAIVNSNILYKSVQYYMSQGIFGARNLKKLLWQLPIPEFDAADPLHAEISEAGREAASGAAHRLAELRAQRGDNVSVTIARRELRAWLRASPQGAAAEAAVGRLCGGLGGLPRLPAVV